MLAPSVAVLHLLLSVAELGLELCIYPRRHRQWGSEKKIQKKQ